MYVDRHSFNKVMSLGLQFFPPRAIDCLTKHPIPGVRKPLSSSSGKFERLLKQYRTLLPWVTSQRLKLSPIAEDTTHFGQDLVDPRWVVGTGRCYANF